MSAAEIAAERPPDPARRQEDRGDSRGSGLKPSARSLDARTTTRRDGPDRRPDLDLLARRRVADPRPPPPAAAPAGLPPRALAPRGPALPRRRRHRAPGARPEPVALPRAPLWRRPVGRPSCPRTARA